MLRIVVDVNLWISFLISDTFSSLEKLLTGGAATLLYSEDFLREYRLVLSRPKFTKYFTPADAAAMLDIVTRNGENVFVFSTVNICRDPKDNYLLALSRDGHADYLLTGDNDLLSLGTFEGTHICTLTNFLRAHTVS